MQSWLLYRNSVIYKQAEVREQNAEKKETHDEVKAGRPRSYIFSLRTLHHNWALKDASINVKLELVDVVAPLSTFAIRATKLGQHKMLEGVWRVGSGVIGYGSPAAAVNVAVGSKHFKSFMDKTREYEWKLRIEGGKLQLKNGL